MVDDQELLKAIADAGVLDPLSVMRHLLLPERLIGQPNASDSLLQSVMKYLISIRDEGVEARVKQILWDARAAMLEASDVEEDEKQNGLKVLDQIGVALLGRPGPVPAPARETSLKRTDVTPCTETLRVSTLDLALTGTGETLPTIEVDTANSRLASQLCVNSLGRAIVTLDKPKRRLRVTVYSLESPSINFGDPTNSIFFAVAGPERVLRSLHATLGQVPDVRLRYGDYVMAEQCVPILHLENGVLWEPIGGDEWAESRDDDQR